MVRLTVICLIQNILRCQLHLIFSLINLPFNWPWIYSLWLLWLRRWNVRDRILVWDLAITIACSCCTGRRLVLIFDLPMRLWSIGYYRCIVRIDVATTITRIVSLWCLNHVYLMNVLRWNNGCTRNLALRIIRLNIFNTPFNLSGITSIANTLGWSSFISVADFNSSVSPSRLLPFDIFRFRIWWLQGRFDQPNFSIWIGRIVVLPSVRIIRRVMKDDVWRKTLNDPLMLQTIVRWHTFLGVPFKTHSNEVNKVWIRQFSQLIHNVT